MKTIKLRSWAIGAVSWMAGSGFMTASDTFDFGKFDGHSEDSAMVCVLANPDHYLGKRVRVIGAYFHDFETSNLFLSRDSLESYDVSSAIGLPIPQKLLPGPVADLELLNGCLVAVEGVIYRDGNRVSLKDVSRIFLKGRGPTTPKVQTGGTVNSQGN